MAYKEHNANGVYFGRVISNLEQCLPSLTNSCFNANEAVRSGDLAMGGQGKVFLKAALPPREMLADTQPQSMVCVLGECLERTAKPASDLRGLFQAKLW